MPHSKFFLAVDRELVLFLLAQELDLFTLSTSFDISKINISCVNVSMP